MPTGAILVGESGLPWPMSTPSLGYSACNCIAQHENGHCSRAMNKILHRLY